VILCCSICRIRSWVVRSRSSTESVNGFTIPRSAETTDHQRGAKMRGARVSSPRTSPGSGMYPWQASSQPSRSLLVSRSGASPEAVYGRGRGPRETRISLQGLARERRSRPHRRLSRTRTAVCRRCTVSATARRPSPSVSWGSNGLSGELLEADVVLQAVGSVPAMGWLDGSGLAVADGVLCDASGRTTESGVYAVGGVAACIARRPSIGQAPSSRPTGWRRRSSGSRSRLTRCRTGGVISTTPCAARQGPVQRRGQALLGDAVGPLAAPRFRGCVTTCFTCVRSHPASNSH